MIGPFLERIQVAYRAEDNDIANYEDERLIKEYMRWYDLNFDVEPQLGYEFSVGYMLTFWEAADNVLKYLEDPDYEVWMVASY